MENQNAKGEDFAQKAEVKLLGCASMRLKYQGAADLFKKAALSFKLAKNWDRAGSVYIKIADCQLKLNNKYLAASSYVDATKCYKKISIQDAASSLNQAVNLFLEIDLYMAARYCEELGELYEQKQDLEKAIMYFERAADLFQCEEVTIYANQCNQKVAQFAAQLEQYPKAIEIFEAIARQSINDNLLVYAVNNNLLNSGLCQLGKGDVVAVTNALERYEDLAEALGEKDAVKFTDTVQKYNRVTRLEAWKTTLLLRVKNTIKLKEEEKDEVVPSNACADRMQSKSSYYPLC